MLTSKELNKMTREQLLKELKAARTEYAHRAMSIKGNQTRAIHLFKKQKKYIAQILTAFNSLNSSNHAK